MAAPALWRSKRRRLHSMTEHHRRRQSTAGQTSSLKRKQSPTHQGQVSREGSVGAEPSCKPLRHEAVNGRTKRKTNDESKSFVWVQEKPPQPPMSPYLRPKPSPGHGPKSAPKASRARNALLALALALRHNERKTARLKPRPPAPPTAPAETQVPPKSLDVASEIQRILHCRDGSAAELLGVSDVMDEKAVEKAWKRLVLLLHPDKLQALGPDLRAAGAEALQEVQRAKEELKRLFQQTLDVPEQVRLIGRGRCLQATPGARKYEIQWQIPEAQDPQRPLEKYEVWGPRYFSDKGEPYDWVLLATLPPLQSHFIIVEEAPTQQDVMWAADRVNRMTLPITVHAVNGKGPSEATTIELAWATAFPWLSGARSTMCQQCFQLVPCRGPWAKCLGCGKAIPSSQQITVRCCDCSGEVLWTQSNFFSCTCCSRNYGCWRPSGLPQAPRAPPFAPNGHRPPRAPGRGYRGF